jgi:hypothetical protein
MASTSGLEPSQIPRNGDIMLQDVSLYRRRYVLARLRNDVVIPEQVEEMRRLFSCFHWLSLGYLAPDHVAGVLDLSKDAQIA